MILQSGQLDGWWSHLNLSKTGEAGKGGGGEKENCIIFSANHGRILILCWANNNEMSKCSRFYWGSLWKCPQRGLSSCTPTDLNCSVPKPDKYQECNKKRCLLWPFTFCLERLFYGVPPITTSTFHCAQYRMEALENSTVGMIENSQHGSDSMLPTLSRHYWHEPGRC